MSTKTKERSYPPTNREMLAAESGQGPIDLETIITAAKPHWPTVVIEATGQAYTIGPCYGLSSLQAVGIVARHARVLRPIYDYFMSMGAQRRQGGSSDDFAAAIDILGLVQPILEDNPHDVFRFVSLLSGIPQETLESQATIWELAAVLVAVAKANNLVGLFATGIQTAR